MTASRFTTADSLIMLVDHQTGTLGWVKSLPQATVVTASGADAPRHRLRHATRPDDDDGGAGRTDYPMSRTLRRTPLPSGTPAAVNSIAGTTPSCATASPRWAASGSSWPA